jgi:hypothetical protein
VGAAVSDPGRDKRTASPNADTAEDREILERFERVYRMRVLLSLMLLPPLLFFVFLVVWFREGFILVPVGAGLYLYMLAQFFVFQNPARRRRRTAAP